MFAPLGFWFKGVFIFTSALIDWDRTITEYDPKDKTVRLYDIHTGQCLAILGNDSINERLPIEVIELTREDGSKVIVQKGVVADEKVLGIKPGNYDRLIGSVICSRIAGGESIKKISLEEGMPSYATIARWRYEHPEFDTALLQAQEAKAEYFAEKALEVAEGAEDTHKDYIAGKTLHVETLKWSAKVNKPKRFGDKLTHQGDAANPIKIVIDTGIRRKGDPGYNVDETEKIKDAQQIVSQIETSNGEKK